MSGELNSNKESRRNSTTSYLDDDLDDNYEKRNFMELKIIQNYWYLIDTDSDLYKAYVLLLVACIAYQSILSPYIEAFVNPPALSLMWNVEVTIDFIFMFDTMMQFFIPAMDDEGTMSYHLMRIGVLYLRGWFLVDLLSSLPMTLISTFQDLNSFFPLGVLRILKLYRIIKIFKIVRFATLLKLYREYTVLKEFNMWWSANLWLGEVLQLIVMILYFVHLMSCFFKSFSLPDPSDPQLRQWYMKVNDAPYDSRKEYFNLVYYMYVSMTTIGYGKITPLTQPEIILNNLVLIIGVSLYSYVLGKLSSLFRSINLKDSETNDKVRFLLEYSNEIAMPKIMMNYIIKDFVKNMDTRYKIEFQEFHKLSIKSKYYTSISAMKSLVKKFPVLWNKTRSFLIFLFRHLKSIVYPMDSYIWHINDEVFRVNFIVKGRVVLLSGSGIVYMTYIPGTMFGDIELFYNSHRLSHCKAVRLTELMYIHKADFMQIKWCFPYTWIQMEINAMTRSLIANENRNNKVSSLFSESLLNIQLNYNYIKNYLKKYHLDETEMEYRDCHMIIRKVKKERYISEQEVKYHSKVNSAIKKFAKIEAKQYRLFKDTQILLDGKVEGFNKRDCSIEKVGIPCHTNKRLMYTISKPSNFYKFFKKQEIPSDKKIYITVKRDIMHKVRRTSVLNITEIIEHPTPSVITEQKFIYDKDISDHVNHLYDYLFRVEVACLIHKDNNNPIEEESEDDLSDISYVNGYYVNGNSKRIGKGNGYHYLIHNQSGINTNDPFADKKSDMVTYDPFAEKKSDMATYDPFADKKSEMNGNDPFIGNKPDKYEYYQVNKSDMNGNDYYINEKSDIIYD